MGKLGGIILLATLALTACSSAPENVEPVKEVQQVNVSPEAKMLTELRPLLAASTTDTAITKEATEACTALATTDKDTYRAAVLAKYPNDINAALDHLTVAAAAKQYICP